jgi:hypothetical protein
MQASSPKVGKYNLKIKRGDTLSVGLILRDAITEVPVDLTGCTYRAQVRQTKESTTVIAELTVTTVGAATAGRVNIGLDPEESSELPVVSTPRAVWDLEVTFPGGRVWTPVEGDVELSGDVSRP